MMQVLPLKEQPPTVTTATTGERVVIAGSHVGKTFEPQSNMQRLKEKLAASGRRLVGISWAPGAEKLTVEERAAHMLEFLAVMDRGEYTVVFDSRWGPVRRFVEKIRRALRGEREW